MWWALWDSNPGPTDLKEAGQDGRNSATFATRLGRVETGVAIRVPRMETRLIGGIPSDPFVLFDFESVPRFTEAPNPRAPRMVEAEVGTKPCA